MARRQKKVPVTERALIQRINRELKAHGQMGRKLKKTRGMQAFVDLGDYYVLDIAIGGIADKFVDIEALGRELGMLQDFEALVD